MLSYASVPLLPIIGALMTRDLEGAWLMVKAFPVFALASPSFVGFLSAYSASRVADLTWGNRPTTTAKEAKERRDSLNLEDDASQLERCDPSKISILGLRLRPCASCDARRLRQ